MLSQEDKVLLTVYNIVCIQCQEYEVVLLVGITVGCDHFSSWKTVAGHQKGEKVQEHCRPTGKL